MFEFRIPYPNYVSALPDLVMALMFLATWIEPTALGRNMIQYLVLVMLMEFIIIHSSAFFGAALLSTLPKLKKTLAVLGLGAFYTLFVAGFSLAEGEWWPIVAFWGLVFNRLMSVLLGRSIEGKEKVSMMAMWVIGTVCYLGGVFLTILLPVPELGITPEFAAALPMHGGGLWFDEPHRLVAFGFIYFTAIGLIEIKLDAWSKSFSTSRFNTLPPG
jgi:hypothetical protein